MDIGEIMSINGDEAVYFHINRVVNRPSTKMWNVGDTIEIGRKVNPYFSFMESERKTYTVRMFDLTTQKLSGKQLLNAVCSGQASCLNVAEIALDIVDHLVTYVREIIWEDIRKSEFPHLPSRQRCIWLIADVEGLKFWLQNLDLEEQVFQILKVKVEGKLHIANDEHLLTDSEPMLKTIERARQYWSGSKDNATSREILFEGNLTVLDIVDPRLITKKNKVISISRFMNYVHPIKNRQ